MWLDATVFYRLVPASVCVSELKGRVAVVFGALDKVEALSHCLPWLSAVQSAGLVISVGRRLAVLSLGRGYGCVLFALKEGSLF